MSRTISYNQFDGGMVLDPRDSLESACRRIVNFDNYSRSFKLTPHRDMVTDASPESALAPMRIQKMLAIGSTMYGLGTVSASDGHTQLYSKSSPTSAWSTIGGGTSSSSVESNNTFVYYHGYLYGAGTADIWKYDIGGGTFTYNDYTSHTGTAQGLVHSKDDNMYIPSNNLILVNNAGSWSVGLTLPSDSTISSICEYGNYLAIACNQANGSAVVYLWDRDSSLTTLSEKIDWGFGSLALIESIQGVLCGISSNGDVKTHIQFKYYTGSQVVMFQEFILSSLGFSLRPEKQKFNSLFYFLMSCTIDGVFYSGLWKIFKKSTGQMTVSFDRPARGDVDLTSMSLYSFYRWNDYVFISYEEPVNNGFTIWRNTDQTNNTGYTTTSIIESVINPGQPEEYRRTAGPRSNLKQINAVALSTEPLTSGQEAILSYRVDGGSWIMLIDQTTVGTVVTESVYDTSGNALTSGREFEFQIKSKGGAEITELKYTCTVLETLFNE